MNRTKRIIDVACRLFAASDVKGPAAALDEAIKRTPAAPRSVRLARQLWTQTIALKCMREHAAANDPRTSARHWLIEAACSFEAIDRDDEAELYLDAAQVLA